MPGRTASSEATSDQGAYRPAICTPGGPTSDAGQLLLGPAVTEQDNNEPDDRYRQQDAEEHQVSDPLQLIALPKIEHSQQADRDGQTDQPGDHHPATPLHSFSDD